MFRMLARRRFLAGIGLLSIVATAAAVQGCRNVPLTAPYASTIYLNASDVVVATNGSTEITATVLEGVLGASSGGEATIAAGGGPVHDGTVVTFTTNLGRLEPAEAKTVKGRASVRLVADGRSGVATIQAFSGSAELKENLAVSIGAAAAARIVVTASPQALPGTGGSSTISARVEDGGGNPLRGIPVSFSTTTGSLSETRVQTGDQGTAATILTTAQAATVTATAAGGNADGTAATLTGEVAISVKPRNTVGVTVTAPTVGVPATVTLTPAANAIITNVNVDFGDGSSSGDLGAITGATMTVQHVFRSSGQKTVVARATDGEGNVTSSSAIVVVAPLGLTVTVSGSQTRNSLLTFKATTQPAGALIERYDWDFGDGSSPTSTTGDQTIKHFTTPGQYVVTVRATPVGSGTPATTQITLFISN